MGVGGGQYGAAEVRAPAQNVPRGRAEVAPYRTDADKCSPEISAYNFSPEKPLPYTDSLSFFPIGEHSTACTPLTKKTSKSPAHQGVRGS